uniref:Gonadal soma derived factor n=1 Tax=Latimeria menadoensis TaxID=106881 RepID=M5D537_LATME|nr:gonadal soma derived factor [Latimeria menadoensis]
MILLCISLGVWGVILASFAPGGIALPSRHVEEGPLPTPEPPVAVGPAASLVRCKDRIVEEVKEMLLKAFCLEKVPQFKTEGVDHMRSALKTRLHSHSQKSRDSRRGNVTDDGSPANSELANATLSNDTARAMMHKHCCQITTEIFITELGWENWLIYPEAITYTDCVSCRYARDVVSRDCRQERMIARPKQAKPRCCKAVREEWITFIYLDNYSLIMENVPLTRECGCQV